MGCRRARLEKGTQLGSYDRDLEEGSDLTRALGVEQGDGNPLENHSCVGGRIGRAADSRFQYSFSVRVTGLERADVVG